MPIKIDDSKLQPRHFTKFDAAASDRRIPPDA
jgi:hypothetical protein